MTTFYESRETSWVVLPANADIFSELATVIKIEDECGGEFVTVEQDTRGLIAIDPDEWPALRSVINKAIAKCRSDTTGKV